MVWYIVVASIIYVLCGVFLFPEISREIFKLVTIEHQDQAYRGSEPEVFLVFVAVISSIVLTLVWPLALAMTGLLEHATE